MYLKKYIFYLTTIWDSAVPPATPLIIVHLIIWRHDKNSKIKKTVSSTNGHTSHEMWAGLCPLLIIVFKIYELWSRLSPRHSFKTRKVFLVVYLSFMVKSWWVFVIYFREILQKSCTPSIKQRIQSRLTPGTFSSPSLLLHVKLR